MQNGQVVDLQQLQQKTLYVLGIAGIIFAIVGILAALVLSRYIVYPINKLIESAETIAEEENKGKKMPNKKRGKTLENVLGVMTTELKEKLSEVSTQKNQIETILLHMTDGIIAFNMKGDIILINPAAKKFLSIRPEDNTFEDIFKKFELNINMEKIIYLENWTSTEQRIQVEDKYIKVFFAPFKNETDRPDGVIAVIQDITEHVKLDNMQKEFVADVSHELKHQLHLLWDMQTLC
ncbi:MAG: cell wall metabolism sensor histidine kinase WalK [Clostridia bacterium]|nr:cell wall metabolism sensor histidine kinase WalK [Clostridia bacterium]